MNPDCFTLAINPFSDPDADIHQATQWQVSETCDGFDTPIIDDWIQDENWYFEVNTLEDNEPTEHQIRGLRPMFDYCWRARVRDDGLVWSEWSMPIPFRTGQSTRYDLNLVNPGAEDGVAGWTVEEGIFEALGNGECDSVAPHSGEHSFSVGGACENSDSARVSQRVSLDGLEDIISQGDSILIGGGYLRNFDGSDHPDLFLRLFDGDGEMILETEPIGTLASTWTEVTVQTEIPPNSRFVELVLRGLRNAGQDNDSYFDDLFLRVQRTEQTCEPPPTGEENPTSPPDSDAGPPQNPDAGPNPPKDEHPDLGMTDGDMTVPASEDGGPTDMLNDSDAAGDGLESSSEGDGCVSCSSTGGGAPPIFALVSCLILALRPKGRRGFGGSRRIL